ncbi:unnamed protein product [Victoria cruziana]
MTVTVQMIKNHPLGFNRMARHAGAQILERTPIEKSLPGTRECKRNGTEGKFIKTKDLRSTFCYNICIKFCLSSEMTPTLASASFELIIVSSFGLGVERAHRGRCMFSGRDCLEQNEVYMDSHCAQSYSSQVLGVPHS